MNYADPELRDRLAAEYALGTMRGPVRRRFERLMSDNADLRDMVEDWELRVNLMAERSPAVEPPSHVWEEITRQIEPAPVPPAAARAGWFDWLWGNLSFWRGIASLATAAAAALFLSIVLDPPGVERDEIQALNQRLDQIEDNLTGIPSEIAALSDRVAGLASRLNAVAPVPTHVAVLLDKDRRPMMTADFNVTDGRLVLRLNITPPRDFTANVLEVWLVPQGGAPEALGLFPSEKSGTTAALTLSNEVAEALAKGALAVSLEPYGGSTTGKPSGPVLFSGAVLRVDL